MSSAHSFRTIFGSIQATYVKWKKNDKQFVADSERVQG